MARALRAFGLLLLGSLLAGPIVSLVPTGRSVCRCADHACCGATQGTTLCPLRRAGLPCGMPAAPASGTRLRSACGCGHDGLPGAAPRDEPAVAPRLVTLSPERLLDPAPARSGATPVERLRTPESPPPRSARAV